MKMIIKTILCLLLFFLISNNIFAVNNSNVDSFLNSFWGNKNKILLGEEVYYETDQFVVHKLAEALPRECYQGIGKSFPIDEVDCSNDRGRADETN